MQYDYNQIGDREIFASGSLLMSCELCGYPISQKHRIHPGAWGGEYGEHNVIRLCPNHHQAIHALMRWFYNGGLEDKTSKAKIIQLAHDRPLWVLWLERVKPIVEDRLHREGRFDKSFGLSVPSDGPSSDQKKAWQLRIRRQIEVDEALYMVVMDSDYLERNMDMERQRVTRDDVLRHPFVKLREPKLQYAILGYLQAQGLVPYNRDVREHIQKLEALADAEVAARQVRKEDERWPANPST